MTNIKAVCLINGPNLDRLGSRDTSIYGQDSLEKIENNCQEKAKALNYDFECYQSASESEIIQKIHSCCDRNFDAIIINAGAYTHTSVAIMDALKCFKGKIIEVHISQIYLRENFRHQSYIHFVADAIIAGCGPKGYELALETLDSVKGKQ